MFGMPDDIWVPIKLTIELATISTILLLSSRRRSLGGWRGACGGGGGSRRDRGIADRAAADRARLLFADPARAERPWRMGGTSWGARTLAFTFTGLVIGSVFYSMPFVVQPIRNAFEAFGDRPLEVAATLRASPRDAFFSVALPLALPGLMTGAVLGFAHTVGEFGVVLMIGGNIPGKTKVLSIAIFDYVETLQWTPAHILAAGMLVFSFCVILAMMLLEKSLRRAGQ